MTTWRKEEIEVESGERVAAQMPVVVSASRSTDIPAFYSDWFVERFNGGNGYVVDHAKPNFSKPQRDDSGCLS